MGVTDSARKATVFLTIAMLGSMMVVEHAEASVAAPVTANLNLRSCSSTSYPIQVVIPSGYVIIANCKVRGETINGDNAWLYTIYGGYSGFVSDFYVDCNGYCNVPDCY